MDVSDNPTTLGRARLDFSDEHDIDEFVDMLGNLVVLWMTEVRPTHPLHDLDPLALLFGRYAPEVVERIGDVITHRASPSPSRCHPRHGHPNLRVTRWEAARFQDAVCVVMPRAGPAGPSAR